MRICNLVKSSMALKKVLPLESARTHTLPAHEPNPFLFPRSDGELSQSGQRWLNTPGFDSHSDDNEIARSTNSDTLRGKRKRSEGERWHHRRESSVSRDQSPQIRDYDLRQRDGTKLKKVGLELCAIRWSYA